MYYKAEDFLLSALISKSNFSKSKKLILVSNSLFIEEGYNRPHKLRLHRQHSSEKEKKLQK